MANSASHKTEQQPSKPSILDYMSDGFLSDWLALHGKNVLIVLAALLALIAIIFGLTNRIGGKPEQEYLQAANDFAVFTTPNETQDAALVNDAYTRLTALMAKHPELHAAYDGVLAQTFLNRGLVADAKPYATATLSRTAADDLPFYADYATTSLLISEMNFQEARNKAVALQDQMEAVLLSQTANAERSFGDELFALNLLRIAMLSQELGDKAAELSTWQKWKQYAGLEKSDRPSVVNPQAFRAVIQQLALGAFSLPDYIAYREKQLKK